MNITLRPALPPDCAALTQLCLRSKAHWGYDAAFIAACRAELTVHEGDGVMVALASDTPVGLAQITVQGDAAEIEKLFVDPPFIGTGVGRLLFDWCADEARRRGATRLEIEADPDAAPFYAAMGAVETGRRPSGSIPGRSLPLLTCRLR